MLLENNSIYLNRCQSFFPKGTIENLKTKQKPSLYKFFSTVNSVPQRVSSVCAGMRVNKEKLR